MATVPSDFSALGLREVLLRAIRAAGYEAPTPIQQQAIPPALQGRDVLGCARTGTGKTAAFVLPMLQHMMSTRARSADPKRVRALVLAPTRELAAQIAEGIATYGGGTGLRHLVIFGGVSQERQVRELRRGVHILVATPGRLIDLLEQQLVSIDAIEMLVIDEFDRMLDQGFLPAIRRLMRSLPAERQTLLFSATMPREIESVVKQIVRDPVRVSVNSTASTPELIDQEVWFVDQAGKVEVLKGLLRDRQIRCAVVFTRTKHGANRVVKHLLGADIEADAIHGNKSQNAREHALGRFRNGELRVLVATDIAARGLDVEGISHVINFDLPMDPETYVHRIGRTARAGRSGSALSLCTPDERSTLVRIERLIGKRVRVMNDAPALHALPARVPAQHGRGAQHARRSGRAAVPEPRVPVPGMDEGLLPPSPRANAPTSTRIGSWGPRRRAGAVR